MADTKRSPAEAPEFNLHRVVVADDVADITEKAQGMNMKGYKRAVIQAVPSGGANPTLKVLSWSDEAGKFISTGATTYGAAGANTPSQFALDVDSCIILVAVTAGTGGGSTKILVAGA